jgi:hypothetical protein
MCPKTEDFLAGTGQWDEDVKKTLEGELPTMEVQLLHKLREEFPKLINFVLLCEYQEERIKQAMDNACLIIKENRLELLEHRFYRMLIVEKDAQKFWRLWKWIANTISVLTEEITITSADEWVNEKMKGIQENILEATLNLKKRFDTFYLEQ